MSRARIIKPSFFTNEDLGTVPPLGRLLFAGLWGIADRAGRLEDRPMRIGAEVLPYDHLQVAEVHDLLAQLEDLGFIIRYEVNGKRYIQIGAFSKHQTPHNREAASIIPPPHMDEKTEPAPAKEVPSPKKAGAEHDLGDAEPSGIRYTVPVTGNRYTDPVLPPSPPRGEARKRAPTVPFQFPEEVLDRFQAEEPDIDVPALADDYLNWTGSAKHKDKERGLRAQLRMPLKRQQFARSNGDGSRTGGMGGSQRAGQPSGGRSRPAQRFDTGELDELDLLLQKAGALTV